MHQIQYYMRIALFTLFFIVLVRNQSDISFCSQGSMSQSFKTSKNDSVIWIGSISFKIQDNKLKAFRLDYPQVFNSINQLAKSNYQYTFPKVELRYVINASKDGSCVIVNNTQSLKLQFYSFDANSINYIFNISNLIGRNNEIFLSKNCNKVVFFQQDRIKLYSHKQNQTYTLNSLGFSNTQIGFDDSLLFLIDFTTKKIYRQQYTNDYYDYGIYSYFSSIHIQNRPIQIIYNLENNFLLILSSSSLRYDQRLVLYQVTTSISVESTQQLLVTSKQLLKLIVSNDKTFFILYNSQFCYIFRVVNGKFVELNRNDFLKINQLIQTSFNSIENYVLNIVNNNGFYFVDLLNQKVIGNHTQGIIIDNFGLSWKFIEYTQIGCACLLPCQTCSPSSNNYCLTCVNQNFKDAFDGKCIKCSIKNCQQCNLNSKGQQYCQNCSSNLLLSFDQLKCGPCLQSLYCVECNDIVCGKCMQNFTFKIESNKCECSIQQCQVCVAYDKCGKCNNDLTLTRQGICICTLSICHTCEIEHCTLCDNKTCAICDYGYILQANNSYCKKNCSILNCSQPLIIVTSSNIQVHVECPANCQQCSYLNICGLCKLGFTLFSDKCYKCQKNCKFCPKSLQICQQCYQSYLLVNSTCIKCQKQFCLTCSSNNQCSQCINTYVSVNGTCQKCSQNCLKCSSPNKCQLCYDGYTVNYDSTCFQCLIGCSSCNYTSVDKCNTFNCPIGMCTVVCHPTCLTCKSIWQCTQCKAGYYLNGTECIKKQCAYPCSNCIDNTPKLCSSCFAGYAFNSTTKSCFLFIQNCNNNSSCIVCPRKYYLFNNNCKSCLTQTSCNQCMQDNPKICTQCADGFYLNDFGNCLNCTQGCSTCKTRNACTSCQVGYVQSNDGLNFICLKCQSPCLTCYKSPKQCLTCTSKYKLLGWKCIYSVSVDFQMTVNIFLSNNTNNTNNANIFRMLQILVPGGSFEFSRRVQSFKQSLVDRLGDPFNRVATLKHISIRSIKSQGDSTVVSGTVSGAGTDLNAQQIQNRLNKAVKSNIDGLNVTAAKIQNNDVSVRSSSPTINTVNIAVVVVASVIPIVVIVLIIVAVYLIMEHKKRKLQDWQEKVPQQQEIIPQPQIVLTPYKLEQ